MTYDLAKPYIADLDALTQEQFDLAMKNPGTCRYSSPCIIGALLPQEVIDQLMRDDRDETAIGRITEFVIFKDADQAARAARIQIAFDMFFSEEDKARAVLRDELPNLDHSGY